MSASTSNERGQYQRPEDNSQALQIAIGRWVEFQYRIWDQESKRSSTFLGFGSYLLRILIIVLAGLVTVISDSQGVARSTITLISGALTILTGIEGYIKFGDRKIAADNRRAAVLAEYDRQGYEWMAKVELETDTDKALEQAKLLLSTCPNLINDTVNKYTSRQIGDAPATPKS